MNKIWIQIMLIGLIFFNCSSLKKIAQSQMSNVDTSKVTSKFKDPTDDCGVDIACKERKELEAQNAAIKKKGNFYDPMNKDLNKGDKIDFLYEGRYYKATVQEIRAETNRRGEHSRTGFVSIDNWKDKWAARWYSFDMDDPKPYAAEYKSKTGSKPNEVRRANTVITSGGYNQALCQTFKKAGSCLATTEANCRWDGARNVCLPK